MASTPNEQEYQNVIALAGSLHALLETLIQQKGIPEGIVTSAVLLTGAQYAAFSDETIDLITAQFKATLIDARKRIKNAEEEMEREARGNLN